MNKVILMGRLTKDPEVKQTPNNVAVCSFNIAVERRFKTQGGERQTDFISCVAWRQQATLLGQYFRKGSKVAIVGNLQTRSYDDRDGNKRSVTEVNVEEIYFVEKRAEAAPAEPAQQQGEIVPIPPFPETEESLPFDVEGY